jgi:hypothetical protein
MMKKIIATGATLLMALIIAGPSFAMENKISGAMTMDGIMNYNPTFSDDSDQKKTSDFRAMQIRVNTESKINDNITLNTRFNVLDKILSSQTSNTVTVDDKSNIQFDRAWMDIKTPVGLFRVGRKEGIKWGTSYFDDGDDWGTDRLEYILPIPIGEDKFVFGAVGEKALETKQQHRDNEKFYLTGTYVNKNFRTGLLVGYYDYMSFQQEIGKADLETSYTNVVAAGTTYQTLVLTNAAVPGTYDAYEVSNALADYNAARTVFSNAATAYRPRAAGQVAYIAPYFSGKLGPLSLNAEFDYVTGSAEFKNVNTTAMLAALTAKLGSPAAAQSYLDQAYLNKKDVEMMAYWLEAGYDIGPANVQLGYAFMSGDSDGYLNDFEASGMLAPSADWGKVFILTSGMGIHKNNSCLPNGNITNTGSAMNLAGLSMPYLGANYSVTDTLNLSCIIAYAEADSAPNGYDESYGLETDLSLSWKFMNNLEYKATAAYLNTGDFWKKGADTNVGDMIALYHKLILTF